MSGNIPDRATCEVCGTAFDPSESRGWCPNEACGRWQHPAFPLSEGATAEADGGVDAPTKVCPSCGKDVRADANFCKFCSHEFADEPQQEVPAESEPGLDQCPDCGADLSSIPADRLDDCPICGTNLADVLAEQTEPSVTPADLPACPACGEDLTDIPSDMRMVCPGCRVDLRDAIEEHDIQHPDDVSPSEEASATADQSEEAEQNVDTLKGIGPSYAERLADAGVETVGDLVAADTGELAAMTDISESRIDEWNERAPVGAADVGTADAGGQQGGAGQAQAGSGGQQRSQGGQGGHGGPASGAQGGHGGQGGRGGQGGGQARVSVGQGGRSGAGDQSRGRGEQSGGAGGQAGGAGYGRGAQPNYDTVVLEVMGQEIRAQPGDTVGREVRTAMVEGGAPDNDAVYVHREHVRVEHEGDSFYLVRLGQNSVKVNGTVVSQHDRAEIGNGDVVSFSEVVTANVRLE